MPPFICRFIVRGLLLLCFCASLAAQDVVIDSIEAVVNEGVVLRSDVEAEMAYLDGQAAIEGQPLPDRDAMRVRVLDRLIDQEVRRQHARRLGVTVDAGSVNNAIEQIAVGNNLDVARFRETLRAQGLDYDRFRRNVEQDILLRRLVQRDVESRIRVSEREIDDFVDALDNDIAERRRYRVGHILISLSPAADDATRNEARARAESILERLRAGEDFATIAAAESDGARALEGGDLGFRTLQEFPDFLADAVTGMQVGDQAGPLESPNGLHVIQLAEVRDSDPRRREETLVRHVFLEGDDAQVRARARAVRDRLDAGEPFAALASELSEDPNSRENGGELPWFGEGEMPTELEVIAQALPIGGISEPFGTRFGWHVLEVIDRRSRDIDDDAMREQAANAIRQRRVEQEAERWMQQLRDESFVDIRS